MTDFPVLWTSMEAAVITGGKNTRDWRATGIAINAQEVKPGDLFFAAQDDNLEQVFMRGAAAAVVAPGHPMRGDWPLLKVADVFDALLLLARAARHRTHAFVIAAQGQQARKTINAMLGGMFDVHQGCRHLSQGLASMPEICDFAVFGFSPPAEPDIAIITDCANVNSAVFEAMPKSGRVVINADDEQSMNVIARARASGIRNIFTFGRAKDADAALVDILYAGNGARATIKILSETIDLMLPPGETITSEILAGALILKLSEVSMARTGQIIEGLFGAIPAPTSEENNLALIERDLRHPVQAAFRVSNMIDLGFGRRTAVLDNIQEGAETLDFASNKDLAIPRKLDSLDLVYACKGVFLFPNAESAIRKTRPAASLEKIASSALAPGDFVTFEGFMKAPKSLITNALRMIGPAAKKPVKADNAV